MRVDHAEEVLERHVARETVALHVEEEVAGRRTRQRAEAVTDLPGVEQLVSRDSAGVRSTVLQGRLRVELAKARGAHARGRIGIGRQLREGRHGGDPSGRQREHLTRPHSGDLREVIVALSLRRAARREPAGVAVRDGIRIGCRPVDEHGQLEIALHGCVVRGELVHAISMLGAVAEDHVHLHRRGSLEPLQVRRVFAELEDRLGTDPPGKLRVCRLVAPSPSGAGRVHAKQKVGAAHPASVEERRLVNDVIPLAHRCKGVGLESEQLLSRTRVAVALILERLDAQTPGSKCVEMALLVPGTKVRKHLAQRGPVARY